MKTSTFFKLAAGILVTLSGLRVITNNFDNSNVKASLLSKGREIRNSRLGKIFLAKQAQENINDNGNSGILKSDNRIRVNNKLKKILVFGFDKVNNINSNQSILIQSRSDLSLEEKIRGVKVDDSSMKKTIKSILTQHINDKNSKENKLDRTKLKSLSKNVFSSGFGLQSVKSDTGENMWIENGVIYRPIKKESPTMMEKHPAPRLTNYEPFVPFNETLFFTGSKTAAAESLRRKKKIILWYTPARYTPPMPELEPMRFCPEFPCSVTTNNKYFNESSLVIFNGQIVGAKPPARAYPNQLFMFHNQEPPINIFFKNSKFHNKEWLNVFNWTMTYRADSTIPSYYGLVRKHPNPPRKDYYKILSKKNGTVAWMVSHCGSPSKRDEYVKELQKYMNVDIYGACGSFKCERGNDEKCNTEIAIKYKFYLAFENGLCHDYISEKFFRFMPLDIITVSRAIKGDLDRHAAPGGFVDTTLYSSPKELAEYLTYLDKNDEEYIKILKEKDRYIYMFEDYAIRDSDRAIKYIHYHYEAVPFCETCQKLWNLKDNESDRINNIQEWFDQKACIEPDDI